jgi:hypothetical protein
MNQSNIINPTRKANYPGARFYESHYEALLAAVSRRKRLEKFLASDEYQQQLALTARLEKEAAERINRERNQKPSRPGNVRFIFPYGCRWQSQLPRYGGGCLSTLC